MDSSQLVQDIIDGRESALVGLAILRDQKKHLDKCIREVEDQALNEAEQYTEKSFTFRGYSFEKRGGGRSFSYKNIPAWIDKNTELKSIEEKSKQAFLSMEKGILSATQDGEEIIHPEVSNRKDSLICKFIKTT